MVIQFTFSDRLRENWLELVNRGFLFHQDRLLIQSTDTNTFIPFFNKELRLDRSKTNVPSIKPFIKFHFSFGEIKGKPCFTGILKSKEFLNKLDLDTNSRLSFVDLWELASLVDKNTWQVASIAFELVDWYQKSFFCARCGSKMSSSLKEYAKKCPSCYYIDYPRISPSIIVAVRKENKILLAHNAKFPNDLYSVIAGFVNPGEDLEDAVKREVKEEVGIDIKNIKYVASQPWPFPNSLMIGFMADYEKGEIVPDGQEITSAKWFEIEEIPWIPSKISIARYLIDLFIEEVKKNE